MTGHTGRSALLAQMKAHFPDRWEVTRLQSRTEGDRVMGTIKIHCLEDNKVFLSDFAGKLDDKGKLAELTLDGASLGKFVGRMHQTG